MGAPPFTLVSFLLTISQVYAVEEYSLLRVISTENVQTYCIRLESQSQRLSETLEDAAPSRLVDLSHSRGCTLHDYPPNATYLNSIVALASGKCSLARKAHLVQLLGGRAIIVDNTYFNTTLDTSSSALKNINITIATVGWKDFQQMQSLSDTSVLLKMFTPRTRKWDANMFIIVILSTAVVMVGSGWAAYRAKKTLKAECPDPSENTNTFLCLHVTSGKRTLFILFVLPTVFHVLLLYFYNFMIYFYISIFCIFASHGLYHCLLPEWSQLVPWLYELPVDKLPCIKKKVQARNALLSLLCLALGIFWAIQRHSDYGWILQDLLGASLCIALVRDIKLCTLILITWTLVYYTLYDTFFVLIMPYIKANRGILDVLSEVNDRSSRPNEYLPSRFWIQYFSDHALSNCRGHYYTTLHCSDLIWPGILVAYNAVFDVKSGTKMVYYIASSLGFFSGMVSCMVSLALMKTNQPALLHLVPCTLIPTIVVSLLRGEFRNIMKNSPTNLGQRTDLEHEEELEAAEPDDDVELIR